MTEHLSERSIERYQRRELAPTELLAVDGHLATCDECHQRVRASLEYSQADFDYLVQAETAGLILNDDHLTYEQLAALVDNELNDVDREIASVHLEVCRQCAEELRGLKEFNTALPVPVTESRPKSAKEKLDEILSLWRLPRWRWPRLATSAAVILLIATALVWMVWRISRQPHREMAKVVPSQPSVSPAQSVASSVPPSSAPSSTPEVLVALNDANGQVTLDKAGNINGLSELSASSRVAVQNALTTQRLNINPALEGLRNKSGTLMGSSGDGAPFALLNPVGLVIRTDRPTFKWRPLAGASVYVVKVYDLSFKEIAVSPTQPKTDWTVSAALPRGVIYLWQVTATRNGEDIKSPMPPAAEARFRILAQDKTAEIDRLQKTHSNSHLVLGTIYAEAGLLQDAQREFQLLLRANPESSVARRLLQDVSTTLKANERTAK